MRSLFFMFATLISAAFSAPAYAESGGLLLVDWGAKDAIVVDLSTMKYLSSTHKQVWSYTLYANPQIDGDTYYLTLYQLLEFDCNQDKYRNVEGHTYDLNEKETGQSYTNSSNILQNIVPGTVSQEIEQAICHAPTASDTQITIPLQVFRKNYYQAIHDDKLK